MKTDRTKYPRAFRSAGSDPLKCPDAIVTKQDNKVDVHQCVTIQENTQELVSKIGLL